MSDYLQRILDFLVVKFLEPICGLEDSQHTIETIQYNRVTLRAKQISASISYINEQLSLHKIRLYSITTQIQPYYMGTNNLYSTHIGKKIISLIPYASTLLMVMIIFSIFTYISTMCVCPCSIPIIYQNNLLLQNFYLFINLFNLFLYIFSSINIPNRGMKCTQ